ncbi:hypothetical protein ABBQ38_014359 [Trebouxia sp. C0009 RCD-2024]
MTQEPKSENAEIVSPSASIPQVSAAGPLWQQLLLSQAMAQNSAGLSSGPGSDSFREGKRHFDVSSPSAGHDAQIPGFRLQPSAFQTFSQQSAAQALLQLPYQPRSSVPSMSPNLLGARSASAHLLQHAPSTDANSCGAGEDSGGNCMPGCGDASAACKRKRNLKQQELNKLAQQRYRERKKERDAELRQVLEGQTARMVELLDNHQKLQVRVKELEVDNVYLRGQISGMRNNNSQHLQHHHHVLHDDRDNK